MISKKAIALCATVGVALTGIVVATPANAEPVSNSYAIVGSDTLEDVVSTLANGSSLSGAPVRTSAGSSIGSFDATGTVYITTKSNGVRFGRPNGSGDGRAALLASINGTPYTSKTAGAPAGVTITGSVDIARSSGSGTVDTAGSLIQVPFGRDAIAYAYDSASPVEFGSIDTATMQSLYTCTLRTLGGATVTPVIPQSGSGTRNDFMAKIGVTDATLGSCVTVGQEHDASNLAVNQVMPMSVSRWVAMNTGASFAKKTATTVLGSLVAGTTPVTGTGSAMVPNQTYYNDSLWGRDTYLVVQYTRLDPTNAAYDAKLAALLDPAVSNSFTNSQTTPTKAGALKKKFGILAPSTTTAVRISK